MALFLALLPDSSMRARVEDALFRRPASRLPLHELLYAESWEGMFELARRYPVQVAIFDPYGGSGLETEACERFAARFPAIVLCAYGYFRGKPARDVLSLAQSGVSEIADRGHESNVVALRLLVTSALAQATVGRVLVDLEEVFDSRFVALLRFLLSRPDRRITPIEAAAFYKAHPKTLRGHLRESRLPTTEKLIVWTRLFHAGALLSDRTRSHEEIALALGYDSASLLHRQARAYAGMTLADLELSGMPGLLEEFRRRLQIDDWSLHAPPRD